ncbi:MULTISPECIES: HNH endonuclease [unclassified Streptomyces]|uniref:HNH endonuclease n=1 Tax=unclassified Streptomyces TaxID=2593676 RepID=UPI00278C250F|nr:MULTISPECIES: HNH endonuclease [unclassified Streptomyces]
MRDKELKASFTEAVDFIEDASARFAEHSERSEVHTLEPMSFRPEDSGLGVALKITSQDLSKGLYEQRMAKVGAPGRRIYDRIKLGSANDVCPLCGIRKVSTLDHYLPRVDFSALAVTPLNLIPACFECNKIKHQKRPMEAAEQTFNPYVDDVTDARWLVATTYESTPATVHFSVGTPSGWDSTLIARARYHFEVFRLGELYSHHAVTEISRIRGTLRQMFRLLGSSGVREHLKGCEESAREHDVNDWKAVMFSALAENDWYCSGGFDAVAF